MFKTVRLSLLSLLVFFPMTVHAADVKMGAVTIKMPQLPGYCELDPSRKDKSLIELVRGAVENGGNNLLLFAADCDELRAWRSTKGVLLSHVLQYQTSIASREKDYTIADARSECSAVKSKGDEISNSTLITLKERLKKTASKIEAQALTLIGVIAEDPNGCYAAQLQRFKSDNGKEIMQLNLFFIGSIKDRPIYVYLFAPYRNEQSLDSLLAVQKGNIAVLKAANGI